MGRASTDHPSVTSLTSPGGGPYAVGLAVEGVTLRGTAKGNRLTCTAAPTLVLALAGRDRVLRVPATT